MLLWLKLMAKMPTPGTLSCLSPGDARQPRALGRRDADDEVELAGGELGDGDVRLLDLVDRSARLRAVLALPVVLLGLERRRRWPRSTSRSRTGRSRWSRRRCRGRTRRSRPRPRSGRRGCAPARCSRRRRRAGAGTCSRACSSVISTVWSSIFLTPSGMSVVPSTSSPPTTFWNAHDARDCLNAVGFWFGPGDREQDVVGGHRLPSLQTAAGFRLKV